MQAITTQWCIYMTMYSMQTERNKKKKVSSVSKKKKEQEERHRVYKGINIKKESNKVEENNIMIYSESR